VAIKVIEKKEIITKLDKDLMKNELEILQACKHDSLMEVYEVL